RSGSIIILYLFSIISTCYYTPRLECQPCQEPKMSTMYGSSTAADVLQQIICTIKIRRAPTRHDSIDFRPLNKDIRISTAVCCYGRQSI
ncbi:MAG: hypothetical protein WAJ93_17530, partial [Candidatus Nitrosopolaris sp.]